MGGQIGRAGRVEDIHRHVPAQRLQRPLVGAGGAGTAVADALLRLGTAHLTVVDLDVDRSYVRCLKVLLAGQGYPMVASHDPAMISAATADGVALRASS